MEVEGGPGKVKGSWWGRWHPEIMMAHRARSANYNSLRVAIVLDGRQAAVGMLAHLLSSFLLWPSCKELLQAERVRSNPLRRSRLVIGCEKCVGNVEKSQRFNAPAFDYEFTIDMGLR